MKSYLKTCPEFIFADFIIKLDSQNNQKKFFELIQTIGRFGIKVAKRKIVTSNLQLTKSQYKWFYWWLNYLANMNDKDKSDFDNDVINWKQGQTIDESKWKPAGRWQDSKEITFF